MTEPSYPFVPKSTRFLRPGDFWALPLSDGTFGCGRVLQTQGDRLAGPRRLFFGGYLDFRDDEPPDFESIAGAHLVDCGQMHIKAIVESGGAVLGNRPLELDGVEPPLLLDAGLGPRTLLRGVQTVRPVSPDDLGKYPTLETWGYRVVVLVTEHHFGIARDASS